MSKSTDLTFRRIAVKTQIIACLTFAAFCMGSQAQSVNTVLTNLFEPNSVAMDAANTIYITDSSNNRIAQYTQNGELTTLAGKIGESGTADGIGASARFSNPQGIVLARGGLVVADSRNHSIRFVSMSGAVSTLAGVPTVAGYSNGPAGTALFRYPTGLAADKDGNIYITDTRNDALRKLDTNNVVTTVAAGFYQPSAVALGTNGIIYVADTLHHVIKQVDSNGVVSIIAGTYNCTGTNDGFALEALFDAPRGLYFMGKSGLLVSDTSNHSLRRVYYDATPGVERTVVTTVAGSPRQVGFQDASPLAAKLNLPMGLARDSQTGGFLFADCANNAIRRWQVTASQPPVQEPSLGWLKRVVVNGYPEWQFIDTTGDSSVFTDTVNIAVHAEDETITYITWGPTPEDPLNDTIPNPGPNADTPNKATPETFTGEYLTKSIIEPQPDVTIKAISMQDGRQPSKVVSARFQFKVATPIIEGENAANFTITDRTSNTKLWYSLDGSNPTNGAPYTDIFSGAPISLKITNDVEIRVRGYKTGFKPSDVASATLSLNKYEGNQLTFGFETGQECSSKFIGAAGQRFYAPVTLSLLPGQKMYTLQFNVTVTNLGVAPPVMGGYMFRSMLEEPDKTHPGYYKKILPWTVDRNYRLITVTNILFGEQEITYEVVPYAYLTNLVFTNYTGNLLGVGWLERNGETNLYDTLTQDLITYSQAHDTLFESKNRKVITGGYSFVIPSTATIGQQYEIALGRGSATADGVHSNIVLQLVTTGSLTNGSMNSIKHVTVGSLEYIVGDVGDFQWFNAGDFGNTYIEADDVEQVFQSAVYRLNMPPAGSDFFDAMDSSNGTTNGLLYASSGEDLEINNAMDGDGILAIDDVYVTFRRSLDPALNWYARYWSNGVRYVKQVPNRDRSNLPKATVAKASPSKSVLPQNAPAPLLNVYAENVQAAPGQIVSIPIHADIRGSLPLRMVMMNVSVIPLDGSPAITNPISCSIYKSYELGSNSFSRSGFTSYSALWMDPAAPGLTGSNVIASVRVALPDNTPLASAYLVHFEHFSGSPNGLGLFPSVISDGLITLSNRELSTPKDLIPDSWRLRYFGTVSNELSDAYIDADRDGVSNIAEFYAGTNPMDKISKLGLMDGRSVDQNKFTLRWPTAPNKSYMIERSTYLFDSDWTVIASNLVGDGAIQQFIDTNAVSGAAFYRVRVQTER